MKKKEEGFILGKGAHPLGCQAQLSLHGLLQKPRDPACLLRKWPQLGRPWGTCIYPRPCPGSEPNLLFHLISAASPAMTKPRGGHHYACHSLLASSPASFLLSAAWGSSSC